MSLSIGECLTCFLVVGSGQEDRDDENDVGLICASCLSTNSQFVTDISFTLKYECDIKAVDFCNICQQEQTLLWQVPMCKACQNILDSVFK